MGNCDVTAGRLGNFYPGPTPDTGNSRSHRRFNKFADGFQQILLDTKTKTKAIDSLKVILRQIARNHNGYHAKNTPKALVTTRMGQVHGD